MYKTIFVEGNENIKLLYLNRPEKLNALSDEMRLELEHFFQTAAKSTEIRVVIVSGKGLAFSAGADLNMLKLRYEAFRQEGQQNDSYRLSLPIALMKFPKPIIAAINGAAVGFGATMPLNCDIRIASTRAKFSFAFARLGVTPEYCSSYFLPRLIGYGQASELFFTGKMINAEEALRIGLINRIVPPEELLSEAQTLAEQIARMPLAAILAAKRLVRLASHSSLDQIFEYETIEFRKNSHTPEHYDAVCRIIADLKNQ